MKLTKIILTASIFFSNLALAQDGCLWTETNKQEVYLGVGAVRVPASGDLICSKLPSGQYVWVAANDFDMDGGCFFVDKYPEKAIVDMGVLKQCQYKGGRWHWVPYQVR
jgi:hypothetical protein